MGPRWAFLARVPRWARGSSAYGPASRLQVRSSILNDGPGLPNKRLKLAGALVLKEAVVLCPSGYGLSSTTLAPASESPAA